MEADKETKQALTDVEHIRLMTETKGWQLVYATLTDKILDLQNINNVDDTTPEKAIADMKARKMAAGILFEWAKHEIYGRVEQGETAHQSLIDKGASDYIER